jgi:hypothetical protein
MPKSLSGRLFGCLLMLTLAATTAFAQHARERVQFGRTLRIEAGEQSAEVTCIMCSIYLRGPVAGDVTAIGGSVYLETGSAAGGDVVALGGDIRAQSGVAIGGDVTAIGGTVRHQPDTQIGGETTALEGRTWIFLIFGLPFVFLGLFVALVVWLVRYLLRPTPVPVAQIPSGWDQRRTGT